MLLTSIVEYKEAYSPKKGELDEKDVRWELMHKDMERLLKDDNSQNKIEVLRMGIFWRRFI